MNTMWFIIERFADAATIAFIIFFIYRIIEPKITYKKQIIAAVVFIIVKMIYYGMALELRPYFAVVSAMFYAYFVFEGRFGNSCFGMCWQL